MNRLLLVVVLALCAQELVTALGGNTTPKMMTQRPMLATFKPSGTLPPIFKQAGAKLDSSNFDTFKSSLDSTSQALFDKMRNGDFDVTGGNPKDIQRQLNGLKKVGSGILNKIDAKNYSMSLNELKNIPGDVIASLTADAQKQMSGNLTVGDRDKVCFNFLRKRLNGRILKKLVDNFDCSDAFDRSTVDISQLAKGSQLKVMAESLKAKKPDSAQWSAGDVRLAFQSGPKAEDVKKLNSSVLNAMFANGDFEKDVPKFSQKVNEEICKRIKTEFAGNDFKTGLTDAKVKKLKGIINRCPEAMDNMPTSALAGAAKEMGAKLATMTKKQKRKLMAKVPDASTMDATTAKNYVSFIARDRKQLRKMSDSNFDAILSDSTSKATIAALPKTELKAVAKRLKQSNTFKNPAGLDSSKIQMIPATVLGKMGKKFLEQVPCSAFSGASASIKDAEFQTKAAAKAVFKRCKSELGLNFASIDATKIRTLGKALIKSLSASDLDSMPAAAIDGAKDVFKTLDVDRPTCLSMVKKIKQHAGGSITSCAELGKLRKCLSNSDFSACGASDLDMDNDTVTPDVSGMNKAQLKKIAKEYLEAKGGMGGGSDSLTSSSIARLASVLAPGFRPSDTDSISVDSDCSGVVSALADEEDQVDDKVMQRLGTKAKECATNLGSANIDEATSEAFAKSLKYEKNGDTEIETVLPSAFRKAALLKMAASSRKKMSITKLTKFLKIFFKYRPSAADASVTEDRSNAATIISDDVADMGIFLDGFQTPDVEKLTPDAIKNNLQSMCNCNMQFAAKKLLVERIKSVISDLFTNTTNTAQAGGCAGFFTQADVDSISDTDAESVCTDIVNAMDSDDTTRKERKMNGFSADMTADEENEIKAGKGRLAQRCLAASKATANRRRKRATTTITCDDIKQLGTSGSQITASQIATLTTTEFDGCAEYLNTLTGWASDRRDALAARAKATWGSDTSTWTADQVRMAGSAVVSALTESEIGTLALTGTSTASAVGQENYYTPAKLLALFNRYLASNGKSASTLTSDDLNAMNNIACGASDSHINSFGNTAYKDSADSIGALVSCEAAQLNAYANHAKTAFGSDVTTWSSSTVASVGSVIGGLSADIAKLTTDQLSSVTANSIAAIPPATFAKMTVDQLSNLGEAQANAVTSDQQNSLSDQQRAALSSAGAPNKTSGAQRFAQISTLLMVVALFFTRM